ncbi:MAG: sulfatase [Candidatus Eisenbacteria bacterium]
MNPTHETKTRGAPLAVLAVAPWIGLALAVAESAVDFARGNGNGVLAVLPGALLLYALFWLLFGALLAALLLGAGRWMGNKERTARMGIAALAGLALSLTLYAVIAPYARVDRGRPWSTIAFGAALLLVVPLASIVYLLIRRALLPRPGRSLALLLVVLLVSLPVPHLSDRTNVARPVPVASATGRANILLVVFDTLRFDHTGPGGYYRETTPNLDRLAANGVVFERAYAPSSWTLPSTASILTSRYPSGHGAKTKSSALNPEIESLPDLFRKHGYRTGLFSGNPTVSPAFGFGPGFSRVRTPPTALIPDLYLLPFYMKQTVGRVPGLAATPLFVRAYELLWRPELRRDWIRGGELAEAFLRWVDEEPGDPFFAHIQIMEPHDPYEGTGVFGAEGESRLPFPGIRGIHPFSRHPRVPENDRILMVDRYDDDILAADRVMESIVGGLRDRRLLGETWVVLTADHGEEFGEHDGWGHGRSVFEEVIRVPLVIVGEGIAPRRISSFARLVDIGPTVTELAEIETPGPFVGRSLVPVLMGETDETSVTESFSEIWVGTEARAFALLTPNGAKLIEAFSGTGDRVVSLFDVGGDPSERVDLFGHGPATDSLLARLHRAIQEAGRNASESRAPSLDPITRRRLEALGYLDD